MSTLMFRAGLALAAASCLAQPPEITIDVVARDSRGRLVRNLETGDLEIADGGAPARITRLELSAPPARSIALVIDQLPPEKARQARKGTEELLKTAAPGTRFAVFSTAGRFNVLQPYTEDRAAVRNAVELTLSRAKRRADDVQSLSDTRYDASSAGDAERYEFAQVAARALQGAQELSAEAPSRSSLTALLALARSHRQLPGRKALVFFSQGLQITNRLHQLLRDTISASNQAGLSVYIFDFTGLSALARHQLRGFYQSVGGSGDRGEMLAAFDDANQEQRNLESSGGAMSITASERSARSASQANLRNMASQQLGTSFNTQLPVQELANATGGFYSDDPNDFRKPARRLVEDLDVNYRASFLSTAPEFDGAFRPVAVRAKTRKLLLQAQAGYLALPPGADPDTRPFDIPLLQILNAAPTPQDLHPRARAWNMGRQTALALEIPLSELSGFEDASSRIFSLHFAVLCRIRNASGEVVRKFSQEIPYRTALEHRDDVRASAFTFQRALALPPGEYGLEFAVYDQNAKRGGGGQTPFRVDSAPAALSEILLVRQVEPLPLESRGKELLEYQGGRIIPALAGSFSARTGTPLGFFFRVFPAQEEKPELTVEVRRDSLPYAETRLRPSGEPVQGAVPVVLTLPSRGMLSGEYQIRVRALGAQQTAKIQVEGEAPAESAPAPASSLARIESLAAPRQQPAESELQRIVAILRQRAMLYAEHLPNFSCVLVTRRWSGSSGREQWRPRGTYVELLRMVDTEERHDLIALDGRRPQEPLNGMRSAGEFGALLKMALDPKFEASVLWKEWAGIGDKPVYVFTYRVEQKHSDLRLRTRDFAKWPNPGYSGQIYVEPDTLAIRRLSMTSDPPHAASGFESMSLSVDYDYVAVGDRDHVMPVQAELRTGMKKGALYLNQIEFRDYKRFSAQSSVKFGDSN